MWWARPAAPASSLPPPAVETATSAAVAPCTAETSSVALCPCPRPPARRTPVVARARRAPPLPPPPPGPPDATRDVMRYLREEAQRFSRCAPQSGGRVRLFLELTVAPTGALDAVHIANIEPVEPSLAACVEAVARTLTPPAFSADAPELFSLTLVL